MAADSQSEHLNLIRLTVQSMASNGMTRICADHLPNFSQPIQIGQYIPDATALYNGRDVIAEAESSEGLAASHTEEQWRTFCAAAGRCGGYFIGVVSKANEAKARTLLNKVKGAANVTLWLF